MKKNSYSLISVIKQIRESKLLMTMKLTLFVIIVSVIQVFAIGSYSQETRLSLNLQNTSLRSILEQIENQSEFYFIYDAKTIDVNRKVSIEFDNKSISEVLDILFKRDHVVYKINNRQIVLSTAVDPGNTSEQKNPIHGKVTDSSGAPLPGVTVVIKGTTQGTITDTDGNYSLPNVSTDATLVFSFVGMKTQEVSVSGKTYINVTMAEEAIGLDEVVAVGYGIMRKRDLTGSVASVRGDALGDIPVTSAADAITGRMAGVQVTRTEGSPDAEIKIRIRGGGSITQDNSPLFLVDGFQ